ncbi:AcrR family transcriptional regulator [Pseudomonas sp. TE6288]|jgi:AcrR family transcriptional regulator|uniref:TetR/AcrR family transcriptional regulator n=2 Tax=Pseudomonas TaxID=286 RepID=A0A2V4HZL1_9PSED|nr:MULTISPECIES: TetR/AcrR family transcriptional regulator [Pseudomonas]MBI6954525.1 TetR family transcriptional regulator [Pseudomonas sp. CCOS 191]MDF9756379.1 AcrR family transcriptional regulator [Pseudomonas hunanensis]PMZ95452.1 TetR family transcriptional regulator [Pseudomonas sp. FW305-42]PNA21899.1 TetR family transcriptional regulator [Pseudomonas sp. MPR-R1B]PNB23507.1 TetR family transcriptional regulator [Pseudomonas sp. DP16D-E2]
MSDSVVKPEVEGLRKTRKNNPEKTRENILQAAITEFVQQGLAGARVDAIAERTATSKRMIYYYFGSKEQLYVECLVKLYGDIRKTEHSLDLDSLAPEQAIQRLVEFTFDHHANNVDFVRIVCTENIHYGEYVKQSPVIREMSSMVLDALGKILARGVAQGVFRPGIEVIDLHMLMSSFCFYRVSNRHTFGDIFQIDLSDEQVKQRHKQVICEAVMRYIKA